MVELNFQVYELGDESGSIPTLSGVYLIQDKSSTVIYAGMSKNVRQRISQHKNKKWFEFGGYAVQVCQLPTEECRKAEAYLIAFYSPRLNKAR